MPSADERIRELFAELTDHFMRTENMCLDAAKLTAATEMIKSARMSMQDSNGGAEGLAEAGMRVESSGII